MHRLIPLLCLSLYVFGQPPSGPYSIQGTIRNTASGEPIRNALVTVTGTPKAANSEAGEQVSQSALSGMSGEFYFSGLPAGRYLCSARKFDFMSQFAVQGGSELSVELPQPQTGRAIQLGLTPYGVIQGVVVNQFNDPLEYVLVVIDSATPQHFEIGRLRTNYLGRFTLTRVLPGQYHVKVAGRDGGTETLPGQERDHYATWDGFAPAYLNGARGRVAAQPIEVAEGALVQANFQVDLQPAFRVRGQLEGYQQGEPVVFQLLQGSEPSVPQRAVVDSVTGEFQLVEVLPGTYTVRATQGNRRGEAALTVGEGNASVGSIRLTPGITISVETRAVGAPARQMPGGESPWCATKLREYRRKETEVPAEPTSVGRYVIRDVFPGEYRVEIQCDSGYVLSATFGGVDLMANQIISVSSGEVAGIDITIQQGGGTLKTLVESSAVAIASEEQVGALPLLLVPLFPTPSGPFLRNGRVFEGLAPGEYRLYTIAMPENADYRDPAFIGSLPGGVAVRIEDGKTTEVTIERIPR